MLTCSAFTSSLPYNSNYLSSSLLSNAPLSFSLLYTKSGHSSFTLLLYMKKWPLLQNYSLPLLLFLQPCLSLLAFPIPHWPSRYTFSLISYCCYCFLILHAIFLSPFWSFPTFCLSAIFSGFQLIPPLPFKFGVLFPEFEIQSFKLWMVIRLKVVILHRFGPPKHY